MKPLAQSARALVLAVQYFTRVPVPPALARWTGFDAGLQRASLAHFPAAGLLVAAVGAVCYAAVQRFLLPSPFAHLAAAVVSTVATVLVTGALHEDGLADTADGLSAGGDREAALAAMKESRIGGAGAMALVLALLAKIGLLSLIGSAGGWLAAVAALLAAHAVSRGLALVIVATLPHVGRETGSKSIGMAQRIEWTGLAVAASWCALALLAASLIAPLRLWLAALAVAVLALLWLRRLLARRLQGFTGDCLGAAQQLCEIALYFGAALAA
ncbi:MAG: cobalamin-5-phosphate synthase [Ramlibacter sp.]|nr:cobalamin-5-phosphate synthase [Ramlibacter sp.]